MKKLLLLVLIGIFSAGITYAYTPTYKEKKALEGVQEKIYTIYEKKGLETIQGLNRSINKYLNKYEDNKRLVYILEELQEYIEDEIFLPIEIKQMQQEEKEEQEKREKLNQLREEIIDEHLENIVSEKEIDERCMERYDQIDKIAREYNFPTAMIIATWRAEYTCKVGNPSNGRGMFQITSQYFEPGEITNEEFESQIRGYIKFLRKKMERYIPAKDVDTSKYALEYNNYNIYSLQIAAIAYNGYRGSLTESMYANGNLNKDLEYKKDGIVTSFVKILKWEIDNNK